MGDRLKGKVAIVTGAGRGMGRAEAMALAAEGANVVVNDIGGDVSGKGSDQSLADDVVDEIKAAGGDAIANYGNVTSVQDGEAMVQQAVDHFGGLDIVVNNAGTLRNKVIYEMSEEEWDDVIAVHLKGHFTVTRAAAKIFKHQGSGRIVNTASESGIGGFPSSNYAAAKEGITGLTRALALDLGPCGVTVNAIRPRANTRMAEAVDLKGTLDSATTGATVLPEFMQDILRVISARPESFIPEFVAPLVVFLCTDAASNINGRDFIVGAGEISLVSLPAKERSIFSDQMWTQDQLERQFPQTLGAGLKNPYPK